MKTLALLVLALNTAVPGVPHAGEPHLAGRIDGLPEHETRVVDLRARFFEDRLGGLAIAERCFASVRLSHGRFSVPLDRAVLPREPVYIELAIRPAERRYAVFTVLHPRQPLRRAGNHRWQALWRAGLKRQGPVDKPLIPFTQSASAR